MPEPNLLFLSILEASLVSVLFLVLVRRGTFSGRVVVWTSLTLLLLLAAHVAWVATYLFQLWNANPDCPPCQVHLPPYSNYWYQESFGRWGAFFGVNVAAGLLFGLGFWVVARLSGGRIIDHDDVFLLTLTGAMAGWPNVLLLLGLLFLLAVVAYLAKRLLRVPDPRVVVTPLIPFAAVPILLFGDVIARWTFNLYDIGLVAVSLTPPTLPSL